MRVHLRHTTSTRLQSLSPVCDVWRILLEPHNLRWRRRPVYGRLKPCPHCRRKVSLSLKTARQRRQSHFSATVWTGLYSLGSLCGLRTCSPADSDPRRLKIDVREYALFTIERRSHVRRRKPFAIDLPVFTKRVAFATSRT